MLSSHVRITVGITSRVVTLRQFSIFTDLSKTSDNELDNLLRAIKGEKQRRQSTLIIGAAGAIGKRLCAALAAKGVFHYCLLLLFMIFYYLITYKINHYLITYKGHRVIATDRMAHLPGSIKRSVGIYFPLTISFKSY